MEYRFYIDPTGSYIEENVYMILSDNYGWYVNGDEERQGQYSAWSQSKMSGIISKRKLKEISPDEAYFIRPTSVIDWEPLLSPNDSWTIDV